MLKKLSMLLASIALVFLFMSCEDLTNPTVVEEGPAAPTNFEATSLSATSIGLKWDASTDQDDPEFAGYFITVENTAGTMYDQIEQDSLPVNSYISTLSFVGDLDADLEYTFTIVAKFANDSASTPVTVKWATADRFVVDYDDEIIKVYEYSSGFGSGLDLYNEDDETSKTLTTTNGAMWDLGLNTNDGIIFGSATQLGFSSVTPDAVTEICPNIIVTENLNFVFDSEALSAKNFEEGVIDLTGYTKSFVVICRRIDPITNEYNYAKVLVKADAGSFLKGEDGDRYVELEVSYQKETNLPYAKTK